MSPFGPWPGTGGAGFLASIYGAGILAAPPTGAANNTLVGSQAGIFFDEIGRLVVTDHAEYQNFDGATMARWRKRLAGPGTFSFSANTILYPAALTFPSGVAWVKTWDARKIEDESQVFSGMRESFSYDLSVIIGWPGAAPSNDTSVRQMSWNMPQRGESSYQNKFKISADGTLFLYGVNVPITELPALPQLALAGDCLGQSQRANNALRAGEGVGWLVRLATDAGGGPDAGLWSVEWIDATPASAQSSFTVRTFTGEAGAVGESLSRILSVEGDTSGESGGSSRRWRAWGWLTIAGPSVVEEVIGDLRWRVTDGAQATATSELIINLRDNGAQVEALRLTATTIDVGTGRAALLFGAELVINMKVVADHVIVPPMGYRFQRITSQFVIVDTDTVTVAPTVAGGTNAPDFNNMYASQTPAGFTTAAVGGQVSLTSLTPTISADLTSDGLVLRVTTGATATTLTARCTLSGFLIPV